MARLHRFTLPDPFWSLELLELDERAQSETGHITTVRRLYLVDPDAPNGLRPIRARQLRPVVVGPVDDIEVIE